MIQHIYINTMYANSHYGYESCSIDTSYHQNSFCQGNFCTGEYCSCKGPRMCKADGCKTNVLISGHKYCVIHTCRVCLELNVSNRFTICNDCRCSNMRCYLRRTKGSTFCEKHRCTTCDKINYTCRYSQCENCYDFCMITADCKNRRIRPYRFCSKHLCIVNSCPNFANGETRNVCHDHKCKRKYCFGIRKKGGYYTCEHCRYRCADLECSSIEFGDTYPFYCSNHGCLKCHQKPKYNKLIKSEFCYKHRLCSVTNCPNLRIGNDRVCMKPNRGHHLFRHEFPSVEPVVFYRPDIIIYLWRYRWYLKIEEMSGIMAEIHKMNNDTFGELIKMFCPLEYVTMGNMTKVYTTMLLQRGHYIQETLKMFNSEIRMRKWKANFMLNVI